MSVLITGGTGFFGRALARRLLADADHDEARAPRHGEHGYLPPRIAILSRDEHKQALMREEFGNDGRLRWFVGDVRDRDRLRRAMQGVQLVVHAAALKRIEVGAYNPVEMVLTNVNGAINVTEASRDAGVDRVVMLSTDKAYRPVSPYGSSKALAEAIVLAANDCHGPKFSVVRYGNVAGSTGSVIPKWRALLAAGQTVLPVTDPECTRFWMTVDEAVQLVLDTAETMPPKPVIPELPAYRLHDLAEAMGADIRITGLPAHEKLHESMREGMPSDRARRMSIAELRERLAEI